MRYFPMFLDMRGRTVLIAGGGEQAAQKARLLARSEAEIRVMARGIHPEIRGMVASKRVIHVDAICDLDEVRAAAIVFAATGCVGLDGVIASEAAIANVVDRPALCTAITPAVVDRSPLVVAIGTEGAAPVLAQQVRLQAESWLDPAIGPFAAAMEAFRPQVTELAPSPRAFWAWVFEGPPWTLWRAGNEAGALRAIEAAIAANAAPAALEGRITLAAAPEEADLAPLRLLRRLQDADIVVHGADAPAELLDFARRDAERSRDAEASDLLEAAQGGANVVVLESASASSLAAELTALGAEIELL